MIAPLIEIYNYVFISYEITQGAIILKDLKGLRAEDWGM